MLPFANVKLESKGDWDYLGKTAFIILDLAGDPFDVKLHGLVAKASHGGGGDSNYFMKYDKGEGEWILDGQVHQGNGKIPKQGIVFRVEPRVVALEQREYLLYVSMTGTTKIKCHCHYHSVTS